MKYSKEQLHELRSALLLISRYVNHAEGICRKLERLGVAFPYTFVAEYSRGWSRYSGNPHFPVPAPDGGCPKNFFNNNHKWSGEYGQLRLELIGYLIQKINEELNNG